MNLSDVSGTISDKAGQFEIKAAPGDSILISGIGYKSHRFKLEEADFDGRKKILMLSELYELQTIEIYNVPSPEEFEQAFLELEVPKEMAQIQVKMPVFKKQIITRNEETGLPTYTIEGPITFLYEKFHPHQRRLAASRAKLAKYNAYDKHLRSLAIQVTGYEDRREIDEFMRFCDLPLETVLNSSEYELTVLLERFYLMYEQG